MDNSIKVVIADDHAMVREGIRNLLEFDGKIKVVGVAGDGEETMQVIKQLKPDVVLLDINMPKMSGLEVLERLQEEHISVKVLVLTVHDEVEYLVRAVDMGVDGYILKDSGAEDLKSAVECVQRGDEYIQPSLIPSLNSRLINRDIDQEKIDSLTRRELEVLVQVASGNFNKEIANSLDISERTVKNHISNIFKKINVSDRTQAAIFAIRNNLIKVY